jgi:EAL domain-containing protein (putative c-di-GMP-specific phosphodiesterase class I)
VIAEGIELPEQLSGLRESGCVTGQGFFFANPLTPDEIEFLLRRADVISVGAEGRRDRSG